MAHRVRSGLLRWLCVQEKRVERVRVDLRRVAAVIFHEINQRKGRLEYLSFLAIVGELELDEFVLLVEVGGCLAIDCAVEAEDGRVELQLSLVGDVDKRGVEQVRIDVGTCLTWQNAQVA